MKHTLQVDHDLDELPNEEVPNEDPAPLLAASPALALATPALTAAPVALMDLTLPVEEDEEIPEALRVTGDVWFLVIFVWKIYSLEGKKKQLK